MLAYFSEHLLSMLSIFSDKQNGDFWNVKITLTNFLLLTHRSDDDKSFLVIIYY